MIRTMACVVLFAALCVPVHAEGRLMHQHWYEPGVEHGNPKFNSRFRVNDPEIAFHENLGRRSEVRGNGMMQILSRHHPADIARAELYLELWGGHPGTANKRVTVNGRSIYSIPETGTADQHCTHQYPTIELKPSDLVDGYNVFQFACDKGDSFWGHYIVEQACLRIELKPEAVDDGFQGISARVSVKPLEGNRFALSLTNADSIKDRIALIAFQGFYQGYDENGDGRRLDWHGFTKEREPVAYLGVTDSIDEAIVWDASMLPGQENMKARAWIYLNGQENPVYLTEETRIDQPLRHPAHEVSFLSPHDMPVPFWSRADNVKTCAIRLDCDPNRIERALLHVVSWDGGAGEVEDYFTLNGHALPIARDAGHDVLYTTHEIDPSWLRQGDNEIRLLSDTHHHGIEILLPGPMLAVKRETSRGDLALDRWSYIQIDEDRAKWGDWDEPGWLRYFGIAFGDLNRDGALDIASGRYVYLNPGGDMSAEWPRHDLGFNADAFAIVNVDGDDRADVIAQALPDLYWFEASSKQAHEWSAVKIGAIPETDHVTSQGFVTAQIVAGGRLELLIAGGDGIYLIEIPDEPSSGQWPKQKIAQGTASEGIGVGDIDRDGLVDIAAAPLSQDYVAWFKNPGEAGSLWTEHRFGQVDHDADRIEIADNNGDGRLDIVISEERYPGLEPDASLFWFEQPDDSTSEWTRHRIVTQYSMNNLDVADLDGDGDPDIITNEHKGPHLETQVWENDGAGRFQQHIVGAGREMHLGAQAADLDNDGDLDIAGHAWDAYGFLHLFRNDAR